MASPALIQRAGEALAEAAGSSAKVILFGSHARDEAQPDSDVDFLVIEPEVEDRFGETVRLGKLVGEQDRLPEVMDEIWELTNSYGPPPQPLRLATRVPAAGVERLEAHDHAERVIRAFAVVVAERGYADTTVSEVLKRAQMSASTFYANFHGKEDAMLGAIDSAGAQMGAAVDLAVRRAPDWPEAIRAACGAVFNFLASRPALARLVAVEAYAAGPAAVQRRAAALAPLWELVGGKGYERAPGTSRVAIEVIAGGIYTLAYRQVRDKGAHTLPAIAPVCAYTALFPFAGAAEAARAAG